MHFAKFVSKSKSKEREGRWKQCEGKAVSLFQLHGSWIMFVPQCNLNGTKAHFLFTEIDLFLFFPLQKRKLEKCVYFKAIRCPAKAPKFVLTPIAASCGMIFFSWQPGYWTPPPFWILFLVCFIFLYSVNGGKIRSDQWPKEKWIVWGMAMRSLGGPEISTMHVKAFKQAIIGGK